ncbi:MAG: hypothetical protein J6K58_10165 [Lachnospiraceae bacterium]|nr:hypothetical protein [Lachnospiraceae bacterium]
MLKKLIKHEWKDTWTVGTVCAVIVAVLTVIGMIIFSLDIWQESANRNNEMAEQFTSMTIMLYVMMFVWGLIGVVFVVKYYFFYRYYKNLFTDHGYLMNTLPVKSTELINAKLIVAVIWQYLIGLVVGIAIFSLIMSVLAGIGDYNFSEFMRDLGDLLREIEWSEFSEVIPFLISMFFICLLAPIGGVLLMYAAVGIGQTAKKLKFLIAVFILIGFNIIKQFVVSYISLPFSLLMEDAIPTNTFMNIASVIALLVLIGVIIGLYFLNRYFLEKKLNLE